MLVVMLILLVATTTAAISVQSTQFELRAAGYQREALQARYVSETAIMSTLAYVDVLGDNFLATWQYWQDPNNGPPDMHIFGEPELLSAGWHHASRVFMSQVVDQQAGTEVAPWAIPTGPDPIGSLGPRSALIVREPVVDITDCQQSTAGHTPGAPIGSGGGSAVKIVTFYCTMTARARLCNEDPANIGICMAKPDDGTLDSVERLWDIDESGSNDYEQDRFQVAHDSRATFITPELIVPVE